MGSSPTRGSSFFLGKVTALGVLCCFALFVCLTLLASFFLPSHLSFKNMYMYMYHIGLLYNILVSYLLHVHMYIGVLLINKRETIVKWFFDSFATPPPPPHVQCSSVIFFDNSLLYYLFALHYVHVQYRSDARYNECTRESCLPLCMYMTTVIKYNVTQEGVQLQTVLLYFGHLI